MEMANNEFDSIMALVSEMNALGCVDNPYTTLTPEVGFFVDFFNLCKGSHGRDLPTRRDFSIFKRKQHHQRKEI